MFNLFTKSARHRRESAVGAAVLGCMLLLASLPTLFLNEGRAVKTARSLQEGAAAVVSIESDKVDPANEGRFVHVTGKAETADMVTDETFGVSVNAIRLRRLVEMYQWQEIEAEVKRKKPDGKTKTVTEYSYEKVWSSTLIDSKQFQETASHENPNDMPFAEETVVAPNVMLGEFQLPPSLVDKLDRAEPLLVNLADVPEQLAADLRAEGGSDENASRFYWSADPDADEPEIGDMKIRFEVTHPADVSILSQQVNSSLRPYKTQSGRELQMLSYGLVTADVMISNAEAANTAMTWGLRMFGVLMMCGGVGLVLRPLSSLSDGIPMIGNVVGFAVAAVAVIVGGAGSLMVISVAWLFYRPLIAIPMLMVGIALIVLLVRKLRGNLPASDAVTSNSIAT